MRKDWCPSPRFTLLRRFTASESGATAIEYAIMSFIAIAVIAIVSQLGGTVANLYQSVADGFTQ